MGQTSNIDDILISQTPLVKNQQPIEIESQAPEPEQELAEEIKSEPASKEKVENDDYGLKEEAKSEPSRNAEQLDDYGNEKPVAKTYTEDEVNERINLAIRERFSRMERNNQQIPNQEQVQQHVQQGFEYDSNNPESWQQQLSQFVKQTVTQMGQEQAMHAQQARRHREQEEFKYKFQNGMSRFNDFVEVVQKQPITDYMTEALEGISDPTAFIYAASMRMPKELERISKLPTRAAQMVEMGKLEQQMKQSKPTTKTPKPVEQTKGDVPVSHKSDRYPTIEEQIAQDAKRRLDLQRQRRR